MNGDVSFGSLPNERHDTVHVVCIGASIQGQPIYRLDGNGSEIAVNAAWKLFTDWTHTDSLFYLTADIGGVARSEAGLTDHQFKGRKFAVVDCRYGTGIHRSWRLQKDYDTTITKVLALLRSSESNLVAETFCDSLGCRGIGGSLSVAILHSRQRTSRTIWFVMVEG